MFDILFETFRKASESTIQMPLDFYKNWTQQWLSMQPNAAGASVEMSRSFQKRWTELTLESLNKHRESVDSVYRTGIQLIEQTFRVSEAKSSDDYRKIVEDLWRKLLDVYREQSESQVRDFQAWASKSMEIQRATA